VTACAELLRRDVSAAGLFQIEPFSGLVRRRHARAIGLEGIVSKRKDSSYRSGRTEKWLKIKNPNFQRR
jgi:ATP-dependent DNA ligase